MDNAPIRDVLERIFREAKVKYAIDPAVQGRLTVSMKKVSLEEALKTVLRLSGEFTYTKEGDVYRVKRGALPADPVSQATPAKPVIPPPNITIELRDTPIRAALEQALRMAKVDFGIDPTVQGVVNLKAVELPLENVLKLILRSATTPFTYTVDAFGVYRIQPGALPGDPAPQPMPQEEKQPVALPNITLDFKDTPVREALEQIFRSAKVDYGIDPTVQGYVNLKVTDVPFENALKLILRSANTPLTYSIENGVYLVKPRVTGTGITRPPVFVAEEEVAPKSEFDTIELTYADPVDLAQLLNITMIPIGTRFGLKVPGATGIINPGGAARGNGATPPSPGGDGNGKNTGTVINSGGPANGPGGVGILGF